MTFCTRTLTFAVICSLAAATLSAQRAAILRDVKTIQVTSTVVPPNAKVKEDFAPNLVQDMLRNALRDSNFDVAEAPVTAHLILEEFSSGNTAKRMLVGFGSGRSTVAGRLVFEDADHKELANIRIRVRGNLLFNGYQGGNTQRRQASSAFEQKLIEEIARLK
jgi:hypothetical protein